jgi:hypothetical protein
VEVTVGGEAGGSREVVAQTPAEVSLDQCAIARRPLRLRQEVALEHDSVDVVDPSTVG